MNKEYTEIEIGKVEVKQRVRKEDGDLESLTTSIQQLGLQYPIIVDKNNVLVAGGRRLAACRRAGFTTIPVVRMNIDYKSPESLAIQADENLCRLPLSAEDLDELIRLKRSAAGSGKGGFFAGLKRVFRHD